MDSVARTKSSRSTCENGHETGLIDKRLHAGRASERKNGRKDSGGLDIAMWRVDLVAT